MTVNSNDGDVETEVLEPANLAEPAPKHINDWFLQELIELAELGLEQGITLTVGGSHIHGNLIGGRRYFEAISGAMGGGDATGEHAELIASLATLFAGHAADYLEPGEDRPPLGTMKANYIHLRDASWRASNTDPFPSNGSYWRGKVSAVDGFMLGTLATSRR